MSVVNLTGYNYSGKGAVSAILREYETIKSFKHGREFELFRMPGGLIDLRSALVDTWSPMRSDMAIRNFKKLTKILLKPRPKVWNLNSLFSPTGQEYEAEILGFSNALNRFLDKIITSQTNKIWPYVSYLDYPSQAFYRKFTKVIGLSQHEVVSSCLGGAEVFDNAVDVLVKTLLSLSKKNILILNNALDPNLVSTQKQMFTCIKHIIVDRDPRFIYLDQIANGVINRKDNKTVYEFIENFRFSRNHANLTSDKSILNIKFENLVLNYDGELERLLNFLEVKLEDRQQKEVLFKPSVEKLDLNSLIPNSILKEDILKIAIELKDFCRTYDNS